MFGRNDGLPVLLVLASTYPRWLGDPEPGFVHELCKRLTDRFRVIALSPHAAGAPTREVMEGVLVLRYRYAPEVLETLVNDGGIVANMSRAPWKWLLLPGFLFGLLWSAWRVITRERPDVVHAHWLIPQGLVIGVLGVLDRRTPPFLATSHGADLFALRSAPLQALKRFVARRAAALTVVSSAMREEMARIGIDLRNVGVQPMGVDLTHRFIPDPSVQRSRDELLFVGRLVEKKGLRYLIDAMPMILQSCPSAYLTVAGFGPEETELRAQVMRLGLDAKVRFLGAVSQAELPSLYRRAAVFVAPFVHAASGDREGLGLVSVEAAGCGCPVVVSRLPAVRDVFSEDEATYVEPGDAALLAAAVVANLSESGSGARPERASLVDKFDWYAVGRDYARLLEEVMPCRRQSAASLHE
jgi:glycosyltransferase involved in cell wall biosynthesis